MQQRINDNLWRKKYFPNNQLYLEKKNKSDTVNRYYHDGSSPYGLTSPLSYNINKNNSELLNKNYTGYNNQYSDDTPSNPHYIIYNIFDEKILSHNDILTILEYYNKNSIIQKSENDYGPFLETNNNISADYYYNNYTWNNAFKNNLNHNLKKFPILYQVANRISIDFMETFNRSINTLLPNSKNKLFLAKHKIIKIDRSVQYFKYTMNIALIENIKSIYHIFHVISFYNENSNKIILGKANYIGNSTTDDLYIKRNITTIFKNNNQPLHPLHSEDIKMMPYEVATNIYWNYLNKIY